jgi:hypothetical protein
MKILVGGAPVTEEFAQQIGADGYAPDASTAATKAKAMLSIWKFLFLGISCYAFNITLD